MAIPHENSFVADFVTCSIGVLTVVNKKYISNSIGSHQVQEILIEVDKLLYQSKTSGRNRVSSAILDETKKDEVAFVKLLWLESFNSGHELIDAQHQGLFYLANELLEAILTGQSKSMISTNISHLLRYTKQHLLDEEKVLRDANYSEVEQHAKEHEDLLLKGEILSEKFNTDSITFGEVFQFLVDVIVKKHMVESDSKFFHLFN